MYGTLENGTLHPAPRAVRVGGAVVCNPTDAQYEQAGYKRVVDTPPTTDAEHYAVPTGWTEQGGEIVRQYEVREYPPPPPRTFNRYKVVTALKAEGVWRDVRNALLAEDEDALDMLFTAEDITEDEPLLAAMIAMLKAAPFNWTDGQVEEVLQEATI